MNKYFVVCETTMYYLSMVILVDLLTGFECTID